MTDSAHQRSRVSYFGVTVAIAALGLTVLLGLPIGVPIYRQHTALNRIRELNGRAFTRQTGPMWLRRIVGKEGMELLEDVSCVDLSRTRVTDKDLARLAWLAPSEELDPHDPASVGGALLVERYRGVERLNLGNTQVTDAGLKHLRRLKNLKQLNLHGTQITDAGLECLSGLVQLEELDLGRTQVTDAGMQHLQQLQNLRLLSLGHVRISNAGLLSLQGLTELEELDLRRTQISGLGLTHLGGMRHLKKLTVKGTSQTGVGIRNLKKKLPGIDISS